MGAEYFLRKMYTAPFFIFYNSSAPIYITNINITDVNVMLA